MRDQLLKILRMRAYLIRHGKSRKNTLLCQRYMREMNAWLHAYPGATEQQVVRWARMHREKWSYLCPSGKNEALQSIQKSLNTIIYAQL